MRTFILNPFFLLSIFIVFVFSSCKKDKWPCIIGHGPTITQMRAIDGVTEINISMDATVNITQGSVYSCTITAQKNIADNIVFRQRGKELDVFNNRCTRRLSPVIINITMPSLTDIDLNGSGAVNVWGKFNVPEFEADISGSGNISVNDTVTAGELTVKISGSGDMYLTGSFNNSNTKISGSGSVILSGKSNSSDISISGSGKVHAFNFFTNSTSVHTSGSGDTEVNVSNSLNVDISGSGNVWYKGFPVITTHISGSGNIISAN